MPLTLVDSGVEVTVKEIHGRDKTRQFLQNLGFVEGAAVTVVSSLAGNLIVKCWQMHAHAKTCGVVIGAKVPVALTSRSDDKEVAFLSLAFCSALNLQAEH